MGWKKGEKEDRGLGERKREGGVPTERRRRRRRRQEGGGDYQKALFPPPSPFPGRIIKPGKVENKVREGGREGGDASFPDLPSRISLRCPSSCLLCCSTSANFAKSSNFERN